MSKAVVVLPRREASSDMLSKKPAMVIKASLAVLRSLSSAIFSLTFDRVRTNNNAKGEKMKDWESSSHFSHFLRWRAR